MFKSKSCEYRAWRAMNNRCKPNYHAYKDYGGRGITVCERWSNSFENFLEDMGPRPENHSLDRIENDGNYEPSNCRWATIKEQQNNRRSVRRFTINNETKTMTEWCKFYNRSIQSVWLMLKKGSTIERALFGKRRTQFVKIKQYDLNMNFIKEWYSVKQAANFYGNKEGHNLLRAVKANKTFHRFYWIRSN